MLIALCSALKWDRGLTSKGMTASRTKQGHRMTVTVHQVVKLPPGDQTQHKHNPQSATQYGFDTGEKRNVNKTSVDTQYANVGLN